MRRVAPLSMVSSSVIIVIVGPGMTCPKYRCSGFKPVALDYRVAPDCRPGPTVNA